VLADYGDRPNDPVSPMNIDPHGFLDGCRQQNTRTLANKAAVIGHFWIAKYEGVAADVRATILRDPISRAISQFFFWPAQNANCSHPPTSSTRGSSFWVAMPPGSANACPGTGLRGSHIRG
jgi:hypothetical protein